MQSQQNKKNSLGKDVIEYYKRYENKDTITKVTIVKNHVFQLDQRYQIIDKIGQGSYGIVVAAQDRNSKVKQPLAIKKCFNIFEHKIMAKRTLRQLKLQRFLRHPNILQIKSLSYPKSRQQLQDVYIITQMMNTDLHQIIKSEQPLSDDQIQFFMYQILCGLNYLHSANVVHRDLKPRNLLINKDCDIKICDFGLARVISNKKSADYTNYVVTRTYRAPELLLGAVNYSTSADIWSVGCIFAELFQRKMLFKKMETIQHIQAIFKLIGNDNSSNIENIEDRCQNFVNRIKARNYQVSNFKDRFHNASQDAIDLMKKMLVFDPSKRISAQEALNHPYFKGIRQNQLQTKRDPINNLQMQFEEYKLTTEQYKDLIYEETLLYHNKQFYSEYEAKKKENRSLIKHILQNSNANNYDPNKDDEDF